MKNPIIGWFLVCVAIWLMIQMQEERERRDRAQQQIYEAARERFGIPNR